MRAFLYITSIARKACGISFQHGRSSQYLSRDRKKRRLKCFSQALMWFMAVREFIRF